jgi:branched-chain amino acid transport system ATP-binding protein
MLTLADVHTHYAKSHILHGISLEVQPGEVVGLLGRNGVGKSTTLKSIMGLVRPSQGRITFEGRDITGMASHKVAHLGIAYVPEDRRIFKLLTVMENLRTGLDRSGLTDARRKELLDKVYESFPVLGERKNQLGGTLSGGEQQMLAIARGLMARPRILLLDEPSLGLAPIVTQGLFRTLGALNADQGTSMLIVEQNAGLALDIAKRGYVLESGTIVVSGAAEELAGNDDVRKAYLGI